MNHFTLKKVSDTLFLDRVNRIVVCKWCFEFYLFSLVSLYILLSFLHCFLKYGIVKQKKGLMKVKHPYYTCATRHAYTHIILSSSFDICFFDICHVGIFLIYVCMDLRIHVKYLVQILSFFHWYRLTLMKFLKCSLYLMCSKVSCCKYLRLSYLNQVILLQILQTVLWGTGQFGPLPNQPSENRPPEKLGPGQVGPQVKN